MLNKVFNFLSIIYHSYCIQWKTFHYSSLLILTPFSKSTNMENIFYFNTFLNSLMKCKIWPAWSMPVLKSGSISQILLTVSSKFCQTSLTLHLIKQSPCGFCINSFNLFLCAREQWCSLHNYIQQIPHHHKATFYCNISLVTSIMIYHDVIFHLVYSI